MNHRVELINFRRTRAAETLHDARTLYDVGSYSSAVNRIYYALFYEATALLLAKNLTSSKHSGARSLFNEHFVKTGIVDTENGKFFSIMYDFRQKGDYADFTVFRKDSVFEWLVKAEKFLSDIENILNSLDIE